ncbi:hypothetical protein O0I10_012837 [Lichtheimia ornata]|uniref:Uncharacterized protein n=1 Tax=Lichtheimia ornata TaxID=688661 RepID=A0AAD7USG0_9FUNG|nr:uncharacterized protein O0I10_012837 [Lichtheimia ornata]KAJ8651600.1 hypothetical protein O0I10_012837 [Lichtheimia ornata]
MTPISEALLTVRWDRSNLQGLQLQDPTGSVILCSSNLVSEQHDTNINARPGYKIDVYWSYEYAYTKVENRSR